MNKKIMIVCLALLSLFVLSGCKGEPKILVEGEVQMVTSDSVKINNQVYDLCDRDEDKVSVGDYISILSGIGAWDCDSNLLEVIPKHEYHHHKHKEHHKTDEVIVIVEKTIIKDHTHKKGKCQKEMYLDDTKYPACKNWCNNEGYDGKYSYEYMCHHNCARERTVCTD